MSRWFRTIFNAAILIGFGFGCGYYFKYLDYSESVRLEQHQLCYDTDTYDAWVAYKAGEMRCFMEWRSYPHKIKGSVIDETPN